MNKYLAFSAIVVRAALLAYAAFATATATAAFEKAIWPNVSDFHLGSTAALVFIGLPLVLEKLGARL